jgi:hypothetical protein
MLGFPDMPAEAASNSLALLPHPRSQAGAVRELAVTVTRASRDRLALNYRLIGDLGALRLPAPALPLRADGLWRHSCFEAFVRHGSSGEYCEFNFSPSGAWAAYQFSGYRQGMAPLLKGAPPHIVQQLAGETFELEVMLDLSGLVRNSTDNRLCLGLAAVIEDDAQVLSYWALKHPAEKPDFHHADSFVVALD